MQHFFTYYSAGNYSWIFWSENYEEGFKKIENIKIQWNSDIFLAIPGIRMYKIHRILHSTAISLPIYASWNESSEFNFYQVNNIHNLKGLLVRAFITVKIIPFFSTFGILGVHYKKGIFFSGK